MKTTPLRLLVCLLLLLASCSPLQIPKINPQPVPLPTMAEAKGKIPTFDHVIVIVLENRTYSDVIGSSEMPELNALAKQNVLLSQYYAVAHPSLPNYLSLISGETFNITKDCNNCFFNRTTLPDLIEKSGRTWKTYQEDMPAACQMGNSGRYAQKHNPFVYFDAIRNDKTRCQNNVVPLTQLDSDLKNGRLPNFAFIMPNMCNSGHDCGPQTVDSWVKNMVTRLQDSDTLSSDSLIFITYDEGNHTDAAPCCGLQQNGGRVAAVLISQRAKAGFEDTTPYDHYSLLKTILRSWDLPELGHTSDPGTQTFQAMWK